MPKALECALRSLNAAARALKAHLSSYGGHRRTKRPLNYKSRGVSSFTPVFPQFPKSTVETASISETQIQEQEPELTSDYSKANSKKRKFRCRAYFSVYFSQPCKLTNTLLALSIAVSLQKFSSSPSLDLPYHYVAGHSPAASSESLP